MYMYIYMNEYFHIYIFIYVYIYIHILYIYIHVHFYIHMCVDGGAPVEDEDPLAAPLSARELRRNSHVVHQAEPHRVRPLCHQRGGPFHRQPTVFV